VDALLAPINRFARWWLGELASLLPSALRRLVVEQARDLVLEVDDERFIFHLLEGENIRKLGEHPVVSGTLPEELAVRTRKIASRNGGAILAVSRSGVTAQRGELPLAAEENLREVVGFEMDRLTPFRRDEVYYHARVLVRDVVNQKLHIALTAAPRSKVDALIERAAAWGLAIKRVDVVSETGTLLQGLDLLPSGPKSLAGAISRGLTIGLLLALFVLLSFAISLPLDRKARYVEALSQEVLLARKKAAAVRNLSDEIQVLESNSRYVSELRQNTALITRVLNDMTSLLPDDTWLTQLRLVDNRVEISGYSPDSSRLIALFDGSGVLGEPKFRSPLTRDQRSGVERFSLTLRLTEPAS
jgi:general secretion pathway protein L